MQRLAALFDFFNMSSNLVICFVGSACNEGPVTREDNLVMLLFQRVPLPSTVTRDHLTSGKYIKIYLLLYERIYSSR
jgi:hypothetical protein